MLNTNSLLQNIPLYICCFTIYPYYNLKLFTPIQNENGQINAKCYHNKDNITCIVKNLNPNQYHGRENLFTTMVKICDQSTSYPLKLIFIDAFQEGRFSESCTSSKKRMQNPCKKL